MLYRGKLSGSLGRHSQAAGLGRGIPGDMGGFPGIIPTALRRDQGVQGGWGGNNSDSPSQMTVTLPWTGRGIGLWAASCQAGDRGSRP